MHGPPIHQATYILPLKSSSQDCLFELATYINAISAAQVIVVDGSGADVFEELSRYLHSNIQHVRTDPDIHGRNGKVRNVLTGLRLAKHNRVVIGDDDVRYDDASLRAVIAALDDADVVRPQNYFKPLPWHALLDTGRTLINRALDGDWPGTIALRRTSLPVGYNADVLFENFELVRTIKARGGRELVARSLYVLRRPPNTRHFMNQRVRQAYDEFARPIRLAAALSILPILILGLAAHLWFVPAALLGLVLALAEFGRRRDGGKDHFPPLAVVTSPLWVLERAICAWLALYYRLRYGGLHYAGCIVSDAASPVRKLKRWAI